MKYLQVLANSTHPEEKDYGYLPYILLTIGATLWPLSWIYANQHNINFAQASMVRGACCVVVNYFMCRYFQSSTQYRDNSSFKYLNTRSFLVVLHGFGFGLSQFILPLPIVHTINCSGTLFIFVIDFLLNHVKINIKQLVGIAMGIIGAIVATNGQIITKYFDPSYEVRSKFQNYITQDPFIRMIFSFVFILIIMLWALAMTLTKRVKANTFQNNFVLGLWLLFSGTMVYPFLQSKCTKTQLIISIALLGIPLVIGQWFYIAALTMTKNTGILNMMNFIGVFVGYMVSIFRYDQPPNLVTILGIGFVFAGVYKTIFNKQA